MTTTVTGKNQITLPASLVEALGLKPGTRIEWLAGEAADEFVGRIVPDPAAVSASLRGAGRRYLATATRHPIDALLAERNTEDQQREEML